MEDTKKSRLVGISSVLASIGTFYSIEATGVFDPLYEYQLWDFNLAQILFIIFLALGTGVLAGNVLLGTLSPFDFFAEQTEFISDMTGLSMEQSEEIAKNANRQLVAYIKDKNIEYPSPKSLLSELQEQYAGIVSETNEATASVFAVSASRPADHEEIEVIRAQPAAKKRLEPYDHYQKVQWKSSMLLLTIAGIVFLITRIL